MKKKYVRPAVTCYQIEAQQQMMAGSTLNPREPYDSDDTGWDQSDFDDRPGYDLGDEDDWDQDEEP